MVHTWPPRCAEGPARSPSPQGPGEPPFSSLGSPGPTQLRNSPRRALSTTPTPLHHTSPTDDRSEMPGPSGALLRAMGRPEGQPDLLPASTDGCSQLPPARGFTLRAQMLTQVRDFPLVQPDSRRAGRRCGPDQLGHGARQKASGQSFCKPGASAKSDSWWGWVGSSSWLAWSPLPPPTADAGLGRAPPQVTICAGDWVTGQKGGPRARQPHGPIWTTAK